MATPGAGKVKRVAIKLFKWLLVLGAALTLGAALAYKRIIPGGEWLTDTVEALRSQWRCRGYAQEAASIPPGRVVFLGSSSVAAFPMELFYAGAPWLNRGLPTETAEQLIERLERTLPVARPAGVVIWTGMNDLRSDAQPPPVVVERVARVMDMVRARFPDVPVAVVGIPPQCDTQPPGLESLHWVNQKMKEAAEARGMTFVDADRAPLTTAEGQLAPAMAARDRKHLNLAGYGVLAKWIREEGGAAGAALTPP